MGITFQVYLEASADYANRAPGFTNAQRDKLIEMMAAVNPAAATAYTRSATNSKPDGSFEQLGIKGGISFGILSWFAPPPPPPLSPPAPPARTRTSVLTYALYAGAGLAGVVVIYVVVRYLV
jgi:hypothetical protein